MNTGIDLKADKMKQIFLILVPFILQSCSTIVSGTTQKVTITSNVNDASVKINGNMVGKTPLTTRIKRESQMHLTVTKEGYEDYHSVMETRLDNWFWGNTIFYIGGAVGSTTDVASGATHLLDPNHIHVQMAEQRGETSQTNDRMREDVEFGLISYKKLVKEIKIGDGPYLASLYKLKNITTEKEEKDFFNFLSNQLEHESNPSPLKFAESIGNY